MVRRLGEDLVEISGNIRVQRDHFFDRHDVPFAFSLNAAAGLLFPVHDARPAFGLVPARPVLRHRSQLQRQCRAALARPHITAVHAIAAWLG